MALIVCPECGKEVSDKANICIHCGYPIQEYLQQEINAKAELEKFKCKFCGYQNRIGGDYCDSCGMRLTPYHVSNHAPSSSPNVTEPIKPKEFSGIYKYNFWGNKVEVYCPRCQSENCSHYQEQRIIPGKTKTKYTANLNPLHPFTLVNKKEKVIRKEEVVTDSKFICNSCGKIFQ